ncbi:MAG TPA: GNAT family N-acetyltransferase [Acidobacteriaceae bacterium]
MTTVVPVDCDTAPSAIHLLVRFFAEEGFSGDPATIAARFEAMRNDTHHWAALAFNDGQPVGVVTVTTNLYVEWGRMAEIADLYVLPELRRRGVARALIHSAVAWSKNHGCSGVAVIMTPEGEAAHGLSRFYEGQGFARTGRTISLMLLQDASA